MLFVFARPEHTRRTIESLAANELADKSELIIYSDGPRNENDVQAVNSVRELINTLSGFKSIKVIERKENYGLAKNIIEGVTDACESYGRAIVLEDDIVTSKSFLSFMNNALDYYESVPEVMHISGSSYPINEFCSHGTYFLHLPLCWGWATWERAWTSFRKDLSVMDFFDKKKMQHFNFDGSYNYWQQLELNKQSKINTWFVFWYATLFLRKGLSLFPCKSLANNIGFDGTGVHCASDERYRMTANEVNIVVGDIPLRESSEGYRTHVEYFKTLKVNVFARGISKVKSCFKRIARL